MKNSFTIHYHVDATNTIQHYYHVKCSFTSWKSETILQMPNWTPGSYMIREYSRFIHGFHCTQPWSQTDLAEWRILGEGKIELEYFVYAFEDLTVRTNYLDNEFGLVIPAGLFLQVSSAKELQDGEQVEISIEWKLSLGFQVYSPLAIKSQSNQYEKNISESATFNGNDSNSLVNIDDKISTYLVNDYDLLYDSPFLITNQKPILLEIEDCSHSILIQGELKNELKQQLCDDLKTIVRLQANTMGGFPNTRYLFILILTESGYGGLEHRASSVNIFDGIKVKDRNEYLKLLELLCHEYFHLWNVKRIRPIALGPFDYTKPNLTNELWIAEGITSFYDAYFLLQAKLIKVEEYLAKLGQDIFLLEENAGEDWMSLEESSWTAWTKFYKRTTNSHNTGISYYTKGGILVLCMQIRILIETNGKKSFTDIIRALYEKFHILKNRGFTKEEFFSLATEVTGLNLYDEFNIYLSQNKRIPVLEYLAKLGIQAKNENPTNDLGFTCKEFGKSLVVNKIFHLRIDPKTEIYIGDEILAIDDIRIISNTQLQFQLEDKLPESTVELLISRKSKVKKVSLSLARIYKTRTLNFAAGQEEEKNLYWSLFQKAYSV